MMGISNKRKITISIIILALCVLMAAVLFALVAQEEAQDETVTTVDSTVEKEEVLLGCIDWMYSSFEAAMENAEIIVYGRVVEEGEMLEDDSLGLKYHRYDTVEVIETIRGAEGQDTITFHEWGGETEDAIYRWDTVKLVDIGKEYIFFLDSDGKYFDPTTVVPVNGEVVTTRLYPGNEDGYAKEIPLETYLEATREWKQTTDIAVGELPERFVDIREHVAAIAYGQVSEVKNLANSKGTVKLLFEVEEIMYGTKHLNDMVADTVLIEQEIEALPLIAEAEVGEEYIFFIKEDHSLWAMVRVLGDQVVTKIHSGFSDDYLFQRAMDWTLEQYGKMMRKLEE